MDKLKNLEAVCWSRGGWRRSSSISPSWGEELPEGSNTITCRIDSNWYFYSFTWGWSTWSYSSCSHGSHGTLQDEDAEDEGDEDIEDHEDEDDNKEEDEGEEEDSIGVDKDGDLQTIDIGELGILDCPAKADLAYVYNNIDEDKSIDPENLFSKHLHDGRYIGKSWPAAKSLEHMCVLT